MGATLLAERHAAALSPGDHGSTFGGNPVAAAASLAVLERLTSDGFLEKVRRSSERLMRGLRGIQRRHRGAVAEVRGRGLMVGFELNSDPGPVVKGLRERGVLATKAAGNTLRLLPPLVVRPAEIKELLEALEATLAAAAGGADGETR
jgi:acetylornithine/succinyldiaminopimelate/putrescine aminotransferase